MKLKKIFAFFVLIVVIFAAYVFITPTNSYAAVNPSDKVATPYVDNNKLMIEPGTIIHLYCSTSGATIYYSIDGEEPLLNGIKYSGEDIAINKRTVLRAVAIKEGWINSSMFDKVYAIDVKSPIISFNENKISLSCKTEGVKIYYTIDGTEPTETGGKLYDGNPIFINSGVTVKAAAYGYGTESSTVEQSISKTLTPSSDNSNTAVKPGTVVHLKGEDGALIYYTLDGSNPDRNSMKYDDNKGIEINSKTNIKAIAVKEGQVDSDTFVESYEVAIEKPVISFNQNKISLSCKTEGVKIYYTIDGTEPTETGGKLYDGNPIWINSSVTVKAAAYGYGTESSTVEQSISKTLTPSSDNSNTAVKPGTVVHLKGEDGALIYYTLDGSNPDRNSMKYDDNKGIEINSKTNIKAVAVKDGQADSDIFTEIYEVAIEKPVISFNQNKISLSCKTEGVKIYYTIDGTEPTETGGKLYDGNPIWINSSVTVKAAAYGYGTESSTVEQSISKTLTPSSDNSNTAVKPGTVVHLKGEDGALIYYTLDGSNPDRNSMKYDDNKGIEINSKTNIKAVAVKDGQADSDIFTESYEVAIEKPVISFNQNKISLSCKTYGVKIYYTLDGIEPTETGGKLYDGNQIGINSAVTVKAVAVGFGTTSEISSEVFHKTDIPSSDNSNTAVKPGTIVHLKGEDGALIYYTLDESNPDRNSIKYDDSKGVEIDSKTNIKALAVKDGQVDSDIFTESYEVIRKKIIIDNDTNSINIIEKKVSNETIKSFKVENVMVYKPSFISKKPIKSSNKTFPSVVKEIEPYEKVIHKTRVQNKRLRIIHKTVKSTSKNMFKVILLILSLSVVAVILLLLKIKKQNK
ncbi:chitobiase/beta-hexosaminidase C-terminal domain-containing protein [Clostridium felsineum]|uniref:FN3 associated domain-containing protein n=1 Tax=Clostridium felsineum TaxID=36839 RepID=UPI00214D41D1|nr:FN3 associated domain-containing protein [Clostridium felsineum]MCR3759997.1 chitobiase/beta-hexosaminidase C-terminal domain-containing protein [Clostridium felsineum]